MSDGGKKGLGRGLDALIPGGDEDKQADSNEVAINLIDVNPHQPRTTFESEELGELSDSIKKHGILQPLIVSPKDDHYELIAGERRLRAAKLAGLSKVPVIIRKVENHEKLEMALIENIHRKDLNPIDEALSIRKLIEEFSYTQEEAADAVGKSRVTIANKLRLLTLPTEMKKALKEGKISEGHGKALLSISDDKERQQAFEKILAGEANVRDIEKRSSGRGKKKEFAEENEEDAMVTKQLADDLKNYLGTKIEIKNTARGGKIEIAYYSQEELARIYQKIKGVD